mmetsp:Transcript_46255/g.142674  ORF Transcript_46255/g.142674 Transcript_46255/m.142674 type:complete len:291 (+) Transcript_46255:502-1374(+)
MTACASLATLGALSTWASARTGSSTRYRELRSGWRQRCSRCRRAASAATLRPTSGPSARRRGSSPSATARSATSATTSSSFCSSARPNRTTTSSLPTSKNASVRACTRSSAAACGGGPRTGPRSRSCCKTSSSPSASPRRKSASRASTGRAGLPQQARSSRRPARSTSPTHPPRAMLARRLRPRCCRPGWTWRVRRAPATPRRCSGCSRLSGRRPTLRPPAARAPRDTMKVRSSARRSSGGRRKASWAKPPPARSLTRCAARTCSRCCIPSSPGAAKRPRRGATRARWCG